MIFNKIFGEVINKLDSIFVFTNKNENVKLAFIVLGKNNDHIELTGISIKDDPQISDFISGKLNGSQILSDQFVVDVVIGRNLNFIRNGIIGYDGNISEDPINEVNSKIEALKSDMKSSRYHSIISRISRIMDGMEKEDYINIYNKFGKHIFSIRKSKNENEYTCSCTDNDAANNFMEFFDVYPDSIELDGGISCRCCNVGKYDLAYAVYKEDLIVSTPEFVSNDDISSVLHNYRYIIKNGIKNGGHINIADPEDKSQSYFTVKKNDNSDELVSIPYISLPKMYAALSDSGLSSCSDSMRIDDLVQLMLKNDFIFRY